MFTGPPVIITHPTNKVIRAKEFFTLNIKATGGGIITYRWENSPDGEQWTSIMDSNTTTLHLRIGEQSERLRFRCIVSNEAGNMTSIAATVTVMSKLYNKSVLINISFYRDYHSTDQFLYCYSIRRCHINLFIIC